MGSRQWVQVLRIVQLLLLAGPLTAVPVRAQGLGGAGTVQGTITDPSGGVMQAVEVKLSNLFLDSAERLPPMQRAGTSSTTCLQTRIT